MSTAPPQTNGTTSSNSAKSRGQLKKLKKKSKAIALLSALPETIESAPVVPAIIEIDEKPILQQNNNNYDDDVENVAEPVEDKTSDAFSDIFARFQLPTPEELTQSSNTIDGKGEIIYSDDELPSEDDEDAAPQISKRKQRKMNRLSVAELKRLVKKPEVVEWADVTGTDPKLLVQIKSHRNTIPVPQHWGQKTDYLQGKRGIEKPAFQLPSFIADTGIATQRDAVKEKEDGQSLKAKSRERVQPKMGKIDIDYQKLHDAFFKFQTKPKMTEFGELYYEGKEFETNLKEKRPGELSDELKEALSIPPLAPPPWLISMQRYGPPPNYPNLRIYGLNAPIPDGAAWGFHPGGWGKPPLDDYGRPLYGDIYGVTTPATSFNMGAPMEKETWGELEPDEEDSEEESDSDSDDEPPLPSGGSETPSGLITPSGLSSVASTVPSGLETPDFLELRKKRAGTESESGSGENRNLYTVIPEREVRIRGVMGSDRAYDLGAVQMGNAGQQVLGAEERGNKRKANSGVAISLDAAELEGLSEAELRARYAAAGPRGTHEDLSDVVNEEGKRRKLAEAKKKSGGGGSSSKEKFKF